MHATNFATVGRNNHLKEAEPPLYEQFFPLAHYRTLKLFKNTSGIVLARINLKMNDLLVQPATNKCNLQQISVANNLAVAFAK